MFYDVLRQLCKERGTTPFAVVKALGLSTGSPTAWKNGRTPTTTTMQKIADYFGVEIETFWAGESKLSHEEGVKIPVLASVGAGIPFDSILTFDQDDEDSWEEISKLDARKGAYFALRIRGDSMEPLIRHGDVVIVRKQDDYDDGDIVIVLVNGDEGVCKKLEYRNKGGIALLSINPAYKPMIFSSEEIDDLPVRIMGKCVERRGRL